MLKKLFSLLVSGFPSLLISEGGFVQINFGEIVNDARGSINGVTYSRNKSGAYIRSKVTPSNPQTSFQSAARARITSISKGWASLTSAQRSAWTEWARQFGTVNPFGAKKPINGLSAFVRANTTLLAAGLPVLTDAPDNNLVTDLDSFTLALDASANELTVTSLPTPFEANHYLYVSVTPVVPAGRSFVKNLYRFISAPGINSPNVITWPAARMGVIEADDRVFVKVQILNSANAAITTGIEREVIVVA